MLLGRERDKKCAIALEELEIAAAHHTVDAKLIGDILKRGHEILREMHLDSDVTAKELYQSLRVHDNLLSDDTEFVGFTFGKEVISLHPQDIALDDAESRQFTERSLVHFRKSLAQEIVNRYQPYISRPRLLRDFEMRISKGGV